MTPTPEEVEAMAKRLEEASYPFEITSQAAVIAYVQKNHQVRMDALARLRSLATRDAPDLTPEQMIALAESASRKDDWAAKLAGCETGGRYFDVDTLAELFRLVRSDAPGYVEGLEAARKAYRDGSFVEKGDDGWDWFPEADAAIAALIPAPSTYAVVSVRMQPISEADPTKEEQEYYTVVPGYGVHSITWYEGAKKWKTHVLSKHEIKYFFDLSAMVSAAMKDVDNGN